MSDKDVTSPDTTPHPPLFPFHASPRSSAICLIVGTVLTVAFMAIHPTSHAHDVAGFLVELGEIATFNAFVHGTLMATTCLVLIGLIGVAERIGTGLVLTRIGIVAACIGTIAGIGAATVNGFILSGVVAHRSGDDPAVVEKLKPILALLMETNGTLARIDVIAMSAAVALWSIALIHSRGTTRWLGAFGLVCAIAPAAALLAGRLPMNVHGFGAFILAQAVWWMSAAVLVLRGNL